jgi:MYXO-CTERM domain-containing protein
MRRGSMHHCLRLTSVAAVGLLLGTTAGCLVATETETAADLGEVASPVIGGAAATKDQIFSTVALLAPDDPNYICSGILIAPSVVVTAAHCIYKVACQTEYAPYDLTVVAGALDATTASAEQHYDIANMIPYPGFVCPMPDTLGVVNDLAIILLKGSITSLSPIPTVTFDKIKSALSTGTLVTIEGYGDRNTGMTQFGQVYTAQTPYQEASTTELIAGAMSAPDTCTGDSGGPVYLTVEGTKYVVGMTSRGNGPDTACGNAPMGGIYTILGVQNYDDWLKTKSGGAYAGSTFLRGSSDGGVDGGDNGSSSGIPGCNCQVGSAPVSSAPGFWTGVGIALLAAKRRRRVR